MSSTLPGAAPRTASAWILCALLGLLCLALVARSQDTLPPQDDDDKKASDPFTPGYGTSDSNGTMIAVTGVDVTGGSILYLIDTKTRHLSVYQATGGTASTSNLRWVGGRNIDLDLKVDGFNDKSLYSYKDLAQRFEESGSSATSE